MRPIWIILGKKMDLKRYFYFIQNDWHKHLVRTFMLAALIVASMVMGPFAIARANADMNIAFEYLPDPERLHLLPQIISIQETKGKNPKPISVRLHFADHQFESKLHFNQRYQLYTSPHHGWMKGQYVVWLQKTESKMTISLFHIDQEDRSFLIYYDIKNLDDEPFKNAANHVAEVNMIEDETLVLKQEIQWLLLQ